MPFKASADRRHRAPKQRQTVTNWAEYNVGLRARGSLTVWFTAEAIEGWRARHALVGAAKRRLWIWQSQLP